MSSAEQIEKEKARFEVWARKYQVHKALSEDEFVSSDYDLECIWTEFQNDDESFVDRGYTAYSDSARMHVVGYYVSQIKAPTNPDEYDFVLTSMLLDCESCEAMGEDEDGEDCSSCDGDRGTYVDFVLA